MKGFVYIDENIIGEADLLIIDEGMGVIGGKMTAMGAYHKYQDRIRRLYEEKGIANSLDFNFKIALNDVILQPEGGIGITDSPEFDEIHIEAAGLNSDVINDIM